MLTLRTATAADEKRINELFEEMLRSVYHTQAADGYENGYLEQYWNGSENRIYLAEDDEVRAYLSIQVYRELIPYLYLDDLSVTERCRGRGIGTSLLLAAESYAKEIRIPNIVLHVEKTNERAFRLYESLGYSIFRDDGSRYLLSRNLA